MRKLQTIQNIFIAFSIFLLGLTVVNKSVFMHSHQLVDGTIVVHSHPYNKKSDNQPYKTHHHSIALLNLVDSLDLFVFAVSVFSFLFLQNVVKANHLLNHSLIPIPIFKSNSGRAPPSH